jgi:hypothetical protein
MINYYLKITSYEYNKTIESFILFDLIDNRVYFGVDMIKDIHLPFISDNINYQSLIPISKNKFENFLNLSLNDLNKINKNIFLVMNSLEEWIT